MILGAEHVLTLSMMSVLTYTEVKVVGWTSVLIWVTVIKSVITSVTVAVWRTVIWSVTVAVCVISIVWVCEHHISIVARRVKRAETHIVDNLRADPHAGVGRRLDDRADLGLGDEVGHRHGLGLCRGRGLRLDLRVDVHLRACLGRGERVLDGLCLVDDLGRDPDAGRRDELGGGHDLRRGDRLDVRHGGGDRGGLCDIDCRGHSRGLYAQVSAYRRDYNLHKIRTSVMVEVTVMVSCMVTVLVAVTVDVMPPPHPPYPPPPYPLPPLHTTH